MIRKLSNACLAPQVADVSPNEIAARALGLPDISTLPVPKNTHLAIVGGGPSINHRKNSLREWRGDIWAINHAALWCAQNRIDATLFSVCPGEGFQPELATIKRAVIATQCPMELFTLLRNSNVTTFDLGNSVGPGSAASGVLVALRAGYERITFFGCEGDYANDQQQHAYQDVNYVGGIIVAAAGGKFLTNPAFLMTSLHLAALIRQFPTQVRERSGGLLAALVKDLDYNVVGISNSKNPALLNEYNVFIAQTDDGKSVRCYGKNNTPISPA